LILNLKKYFVFINIFNYLCKCSTNVLKYYRTWSKTILHACTIVFDHHLTIFFCYKALKTNNIKYISISEYKLEQNYYIRWHGCALLLVNTYVVLQKSQTFALEQVSQFCIVEHNPKHKTQPLKIFSVGIFQWELLEQCLDEGLLPWYKLCCTVFASFDIRVDGVIAPSIMKAKESVKGTKC